MIQLRSAFVSLFTREQLAELLAQTYADIKNIDPNEAYRALANGLNDFDLLSGLQRALWDAFAEQHPDFSDDQRIERLEKRMAKPKRPRAPKGREQEDALAAFALAVDVAAGVGSGEGYELLRTPRGAALLEAGIRAAGTHLATAIWPVSRPSRASGPRSGTSRSRR